MIESHFHIVFSISRYKTPNKKILGGWPLEPCFIFCPNILSQAEPVKLRATAVHKIHPHHMWLWAMVLECLILPFSCALVFCLQMSLSLVNYGLVIKLPACSCHCVSLLSLQIAKFNRGHLRGLDSAPMCMKVVT